MNRRPFRTQRSELVRVVVGDLAGIDAAHAVRDLLRARERHLERDLLVEQHTDE